MPDVVRMASHARHFLRIYDKHTSRELYLGETKRIARPPQRIVLHANLGLCAELPALNEQPDSHTYRADGKKNRAYHHGPRPNHHLPSFLSAGLREWEPLP